MSPLEITQLRAGSFAAALAVVLLFPGRQISAQIPEAAFSLGETAVIGPVIPEDEQVVGVTAGDATRILEDLASLLPRRANLDALSMVQSDAVYFSLDVDLPTTIGLVSDEDVMLWDGANITLAWDGSAEGVSLAADLDAIEIIQTSPLEFVCSFDTAARLMIAGQPGLVDDADLVRWREGAGFLSIDFEAFAAGVSPSADLDAAAIRRTGFFVISFDSPVIVDGVAFTNRDLIPSTASIIGAIVLDYLGQIILPPASDLDALTVAPSSSIGRWKAYR